MQKSTDAESINANHYGLEPRPPSAREQSVVRVPFKQLGFGPRGVTVRGGCHDETMHRLQAPIPPNELRGQPVEQLGIAGRLALDPEVLAGFDKASAEMLGPDAVHGHSADEWIIRIDQPARQCKSIDRLSSGQRVKLDGNAGRYGVSLSLVVAANQDICRSRLI